MKDNSSIISYIAICFSALSLIIVLSRFLEVRTNDASFIISVLSLLVTALIGWNIYSVVDINKKSEQLKKYLNEVDIVRNSINDVRNESQAALFYLQGNVRLNMKSCNQHLFTFYVYQTALWYALMQDTSFSIGIITSILNEMDILLDRIEKENDRDDIIGNVELEQLKNNMNDIIKSGNKSFSRVQREQFITITNEIRKLYNYETGI